MIIYIGGTNLKIMNRRLNQKRVLTNSSLELILAILIATLASAAAFSNLLFCSNDVYPLTSDALGHLAKVRYLAECFARLEFPSWYPFWYNGSTVMQYYPPLSYLMMAPIELIVHNVTLTYKIFCFIVLFVGGLGVWTFCRKLIGKWCGLFGIVTYCLQPFLTRSLFGAGVLAQGPVFAISPWFILVVLLYAKKTSRKGFFYATLLTFLLIMSHAMHAFMVCLCIMLVLLMFIINKEITFRDYCSVGISMALGALIAAFWWVVGVTGLENPGIPHLLEEASLLYTATWEWFVPGLGDKAGLIFAFPILLACIGAMVLYFVSSRKYRKSDNDHYYILYNIGLTIFTIMFSFGQNAPYFKLIPLYTSLVPGRILSLTSVSGAILCSYLIYSIVSLLKGKVPYYKTISLSFCVVIMALIIWGINPYKDNHATVDLNTQYKYMFSMLNATGSAFEKGRYEWLARVDSAESYFPIQCGFNTSDGWNIEGTPHNRSIWGFNIALSSGCEDYIIKNLLFWNVRAVFTLEDRVQLRKALESSIYDFKYKKNINQWNPGVLYTSELPSSYFLIDNRNALTLGKGSLYISMEFPYMVKNYSNDITKYHLEELKRYKLIYIAEPPITTLKQARQFESAVTELVNSGVMVIIEPSNSQTIPVFGVSSYNFLFERNPQLIREPSVKSIFEIEKIDFNEKGTTRALSGLDETYYKLHMNDGRVTTDIIGAKSVGNGKIYFIGMHLSQYLKAGTLWINGNIDDNQTIYTPYADEVKVIINDFIDQVAVNKNYVPEAFPVINSSWNYAGGNFEYESSRNQQITLSVTYSPRWSAKIDHKPVTVKNRENLIVLDLPAGKHTVSLDYGISKFGILGYAITTLSIGLFILCIVLFDGFLLRLERIVNSIYLYFGINPTNNHELNGP